VKQLGLPVTAGAVERLVRAGYEVLTRRGYCSSARGCERLLLAVVARALQIVTGFPICGAPNRMDPICRPRRKGLWSSNSVPLATITAEVLGAAGIRTDRRALVARWIQRIAEEIGRPDLVPRAMGILERALQRLEGVKARTAAAAILWLAARGEAPKTRVADAARITYPTLERALSRLLR